MKILHIIDSEGLYGAEMVLLNLAGEQLKSGDQPVIASIREKNEHDTPLEDEARRRGVETVTFRMLDGPNFPGAWRILRYAHERSIDVMHSHGYKSDILLGFIPRRVRRIPLVGTLHGWTSMQRLSKLMVYEILDGFSLGHLDAVCVVNPVMLDHPRVKKLERGARFVANGIPGLPEAVEPPDDGIAEFCRQGFTLATIGRLSKEKGQEYLLEAFAMFLRAAPDARLLIIGEGPERGALEKTINRMKLENRVLLPGYRDQAWRYLRFCRAFVLPSLTEGLPITLLEAMRAGVPAIATAVGAIPQVLDNGKSGLLVPPRRPDAICESLTSIHENAGLAERISSCASDRVRNEYSSSKMARHYGEIYESLCPGKGR